MEQHKAKLIITRTSEWNNRMRDIHIQLDGEKIGEIENGGTREFDIEPGEHILSAKIDWCSSPEISLQFTAGEPKHFELSGFKYGAFLMPIILAIGLIYFVFGERLSFAPELFLLLTLPPALYVIYNITFGRKRYLRLKER